MIKKANQEIQREVMACLYLLTLKTTYVKIGWLVVLLFYVHGKHLRSCRDGQLT